MKKVLMIAYFFPPLSGSGVQRTLKFARYLPGFAWEPVILTVKNSSFLLKDESLEKELPGSLVIKRSMSLERDKILGWLKKMTGKKDKIRFGREEKKRIPLKTRIINALTIPDPQLGWLPFAFLSGLRIIKKEKIDVI